MNNFMRGVTTCALALVPNLGLAQSKPNNGYKEAVFKEKPMVKCTPTEEDKLGQIFQVFSEIAADTLKGVGTIKVWPEKVSIDLQNIYKLRDVKYGKVIVARACLMSSVPGHTFTQQNQITYPKTFDENNHNPLVGFLRINVSGGDINLKTRWLTLSTTLWDTSDPKYRSVTDGLGYGGVVAIERR